MLPPAATIPAMARSQFRVTCGHCNEIFVVSSKFFFQKQLAANKIVRLFHMSQSACCLRLIRSHWSLNEKSHASSTL